MKFIYFPLIISFFSLSSSLCAQNSAKDSVDTAIKFSADFKFRLEQDWDSRKSDGSYRTDRTWTRYRFRFGVQKRIDEHFLLGARIRTGTLRDRQGAPLTIGRNTGEFGSAQIGFDKAFAKYENKQFWAWIGKNSYPFWKQNELLWGDNVLPEGAALGYKLKQRKLTLAPTASYFTFKSANRDLGADSYIMSAQLLSTLTGRPKEKLEINIGGLYFSKMPNFPDDQATYTQDYHIITASFNYRFPIWNSTLSIGGDSYFNTIDYTNNEHIVSSIQNEKKGFVVNLKFGQLSKKGDFIFHAYYSHIGKYAIVDYLAQNDWARWDYSGVGAIGSRMSNFKGLELRAGYKLTDKVKLSSRFFLVEEIMKMGEAKETGKRIRLDIDLKF